MIEDTELLRRYVREKSEGAFAEIVRRRVDLVYSVALRRVGGDAHLAQDVTQKVFVDLARKAATLTDRPVLSGWLYRSTQFAASDLVRTERRRRVREQESQAMYDESSNPTSAADWDKLRPLLDDAMNELSEPDRDAVLLRFVEARSFADIGRALQLTDEAARKRVERALDKLAAALSRRGVTSTAAALGVALGSQTLVAAPAGLAASVTGAALASATAGGVVAAVGLAGFMGTFKATVAVGAVALVAAGVGVYEWNQARTAQAALAGVRMEQQKVRQQVAALEQRATAAEQRALAAEEDASKLLAAVQAKAKAEQAMAANKEAPAEPMTADMVNARYKRAQELARTGDPAEALKEFLWCFDTGMPPVTGFGGVRFSFLLGEIAKLGKRYPPALDALRERRDRAEKRLVASGSDFDAVKTFSAINRYLNENDRTVAMLDQFPAGDRRRATLAMGGFEELVERRRYADALTGRTVTQLMRQFDAAAEEPQLPPNTPDLENIRKALRSSVVANTAKNIEVLAGGAKLEEARTLAGRVLKYDSTPETRALLQKHTERAGQPDLLKGL